MKTVLTLGFILFVGCATASAQASYEPYNPQMQPNTRGSTPLPPSIQATEQARENRQQNGGFARLARVSKTRQVNSTIKPLNPQMSKAAGKLLKPDDAALAEHNQFLKQPNTGLARLFSASDCNVESGVIDVQSDICKKRSEMPGGGAGYSFRKKQNQVLEFSDVQLNEGWFVASGFATQGIMVALDKVDLAQASLDLPAAEYLKNFAAAQTLEQANTQLQTLANGIREKNFFYRSGLPVKENTTYLLRSISYRGEAISERIRLYEEEAIYTGANFSDKRADVIIAFRIVKKEENGSLLILWKELRRNSAPELKIKK